MKNKANIIPIIIAVALFATWFVFRNSQNQYLLKDYDSKVDGYWALVVQSDVEDKYWIFDRPDLLEKFKSEWMLQTSSNAIEDLTGVSATLFKDKEVIVSLDFSAPNLKDLELSGIAKHNKLGYLKYDGLKWLLADKDEAKLGESKTLKASTAEENKKNYDSIANLLTTAMGSSYMIDESKNDPPIYAIDYIEW